MKRAFTLIELVFVIIITGIIGVISSDIIYKIYDVYIFQKELSTLQLKSRRVLSQISNYLDRSIKQSIAEHDSSNDTYKSIFSDVVANSATTSQNTFLIWIDKDLESKKGLYKNGENYPGYSSLLNLKESNGTYLKTVDCNLSIVSQFTSDIVGGSEQNRSAIYFLYANSKGDVESRFYKNPTSLFGIGSFISETEMNLSKKPEQIGDIYNLTYTAYALQLDDDRSSDDYGKLKLYWNFKPWQNENINDANSSFLSDNISSFEYVSQSDGTVIRLKMCFKIKMSDKNEFCKEAVVTK